MRTGSEHDAVVLLDDSLLLELALGRHVREHDDGL